MGGRYDIAQRVKEVLEASDPLKYGQTDRSGSIELSPPPELSPAPSLSSLATPLIPAYEPPVAPVPPPTPPVSAWTPPPPPASVPALPPPPAPPVARMAPSPAAASVPISLGAAELFELSGLLRDGRRMLAVTRYGELAGLELVEARAGVEALEARLADPALARYLRDGNGQLAAKRYGELIGLPSANMPSPPPSPPPPAAETIDAELATLLREGRKIMAVKRYRELTGVGLADAKAAVEALERRLGDGQPVAAPPAPRAAPAPPPASGPAPAPTQVPEWLQPVVAQLRRGDKIGAIKAYRDATGVGLAEAKETVERLGRQLDASAAAPAPARRPATSDMDLLAEEVVRLVQQGQKIQAIKRYREVTNSGLAEAKEAVEIIEARLNARPR